MILDALAQARTKMLPGTLSGRSKVAQPVTPTRRPEQAQRRKCLTETFNGPDSITTIGTRSWEVFKRATTSSSGFGSGSVTGGAGILVQRSGTASLEQPPDLTSNPFNSPIYPVRSCNAECLTDTGIPGDITISYTIAAVGAGGAGAGQFTQQDIRLCAHGADVDNGDMGWVFWIRLDNTGTIRFLQLSCWTQGTAFFWDTGNNIFPIDTGPQPPLTPGDVITMTVTRPSAGADVRIVCKVNDQTWIDTGSGGAGMASVATLLSDNPGMTTDDLPGSTGKHGFWITANAANNGGTFWSSLHDNAVAIDNFKACRA